jgi:CRP-like cAMP-binding protein
VHLKGDPGEGLFWVSSGRIRVSTVSSDGRELVLTDLEPGSFFGEISVFDDLPRTHDAYALRRSELVYVAKEKLEALLAERPELARHFLRALALKLRLCMTALDSVALSSVGARLALRLLLLARRDASSSNPSEVAVSHSDLAMMVGATRQSVNKELKAWERAGILRLHGRRLSIVNEQALSELVRR